MNALLSRLTFRSAGESHGPCLVALVEGVPRGLRLDVPAIDAALRRRQGGVGRGGRQRIEADRVRVLAGLRRGATIGSPLALQIDNRDDTIDELAEPTRPRPGHADLAGCYRWHDSDIRGTLERASARETAARVAAGAVARQLLAALGGDVFGFVRGIATAELAANEPPASLDAAALVALRDRRDGSRVYTLDAAAEAAMLEHIQAAGRDGDTVGGIIEVLAFGVLPGLGSCLQWNERLDARLAAAVMSIPAIKGVEIGLGFASARRLGGEVHDAITAVRAQASGAFVRSTNRAGGIEGGMTNGESIVVRAAMKPIPTLRRGLGAVDLATGAAATSGYERSDVCAVPAASVVAEAMVALVLADATLTRLGGETLAELSENARRHVVAVRELGQPRAPGGSPP